MASLVERTLSVSSILSRNLPPWWRANSQLNTAVRAPPICRNPVGEGAKRVTTGLSLALNRGFLSTYAAMQWTSAPNIGEAPLPQRARSYWKTRFSAAGEEVEKLLEIERAQLPPWVVVGFGTGIAAWFALDEPKQWLSFLCLAAATSLAGLALGKGRAGRALGWFALAAALGCILVWMRSAWVEQPRLSRPAVVAVTGQVEAVDHPGGTEVETLTVAAADTALPPRVRISIDEEKF